MRDAMTQEIQSCLKYHVMKAALRSQIAPKDVMKMRWILLLQGQKTSQRTTGDNLLP